MMQPTSCALLHTRVCCPCHIPTCSYLAMIVGLADVVYSREVGLDIVMGEQRPAVPARAGLLQ